MPDRPLHDASPDRSPEREPQPRIPMPAGLLPTLYEILDAAILVLHGTVDRTVPVGAAQRLAYIAKTAGSPVELQLYEGVGHGFDRAKPQTYGMEAATADAWNRTLAFLGKRLKP